MITYPEARSALARLRREGNLTPEEYALSKANLEEDWPEYLVIEITPDVWQTAGDLAEKHALRGFDSLHLASFLQVVGGGSVSRPSSLPSTAG